MDRLHPRRPVDCVWWQQVIICSHECSCYTPRDRVLAMQNQANTSQCNVGLARSGVVRLLSAQHTSQSPISIYEFWLSDYITLTKRLWRQRRWALSNAAAAAHRELKKMRCDVTRVCCSMDNLKWINFNKAFNNTTASCGVLVRLRCLVYFILLGAMTARDVCYTSFDCSFREQRSVTKRA